MRQRRAVGRRLQRLGEQLRGSRATSPSSSLSLIGCTHRSKRDELRRDHRDDHRVERALEDRLDLPALWIFSAVPCRPEAGAERVDVGGRRRRLADDREPRALALQARAPAAARSRRRSGSGSGTGRCRRRARAGKVVGTQPNAGVPVRVGVPPSATTAARAARRAAAGELQRACRRPCRRCP